MMKIFRNVRKQLASESKVMAYLRYAIGEILLVVIGILIALEVNNRNRDRLAPREGKHINRNIHEEFIKNQELLKTEHQLNQDAFKVNLILVILKQNYDIASMAIKVK